MCKDGQFSTVFSPQKMETSTGSGSLTAAVGHGHLKSVNFADTSAAMSDIMGGTAGTAGTGGNGAMTGVLTVPHSSSMSDANGSMTSLVRKLPAPPTADDLAEQVRIRLLPDKVTYDKTREFPGIAQQKLSRKDKHMKALDDYAKLLDKVSETLEQELLTSSRSMRDRLEEVDIEREEKHKQYRDDSFLIIRSEDDLIEELGSLKALLARRGNIVEDYAAEIDGLEAKRADILTREMKKLVDTLISIGRLFRNSLTVLVSD
jgi:hypothetical protein